MPPPLTAPVAAVRTAEPTPPPSAASSALKPVDPAAPGSAVEQVAKKLMVPGAVVLLRTPQGAFRAAVGTADLRVASHTKTPRP